MPESTNRRPILLPERFTFRLPGDMAEAVRAAAERERVTASELTHRIVAARLCGSALPSADGRL